jgi:excinuclease UvrABC helicase subunit UvrB
MLDLFGNFGRNRKSFDEMMNELNSMFNEPMFVKGRTNVEKGSDENGEWTKETFTSNDGSYQITSIVRVMGGDGKEYSPKSKSSYNELDILKSQLEKAVEEQEFEKAVELRDKIKSFENNQEKIKDLESELKKAIEGQDFEKDIKIRDEIKNLKS